MSLFSRAPLSRRRLVKNSLGAGLLAFAGLAGPAQAEEQEILNVSYDIARELYAALNPVFAEEWKAETGNDLTIQQSHAGSSKQARAILQGLQADVVTFNQVLDVQVLADRGGFVAEDWKSALPNNASPYYSLPAFLVRGGNPKGIEDWDDLVREDVSLVFPNPKTSGNGRYTYLAAYAYALEASGGDEAAALDFVGKLLKNVAVFDTGGRGATTTFVERNIGDVLITFEAEVENIRAAEDDGAYERVVPETSLLAEFPVALVEKVAEQRGTADIGRAYLEFLYSTEAQRIIASFNNRVHDPEVVEETADQFPEVRLLTVDDVFGSWEEAQEAHFGDGGTLDQVFRN
ncbi:thiosulfate ABC transporter substrate-binding protein CysP [Mangrovicoccus algicola]|uniref:Thiosulfate ABC transporter substrate-binding protein CysP n=1 Tax=Mangrovicoccus algicola TaxID=2771008 RepID=A0A8J6Z9L5_9RHOB|nr:thiosulfate ABC transporter substrate-binding protein CysP [Mangrovicoccus algicola]MBE3638855.1 thiosulfate ABC transporter substrate-binding protein CysP [Mangrovicoccus algicola]